MPRFHRYETYSEMFHTRMEEKAAWLTVQRCRRLLWGPVRWNGGSSDSCVPAIRAGNAIHHRYSDLPRTKEVFLHKPNRVFDSSLAFRVCLIRHPKPDILFCTEIFKDSGLNDLTIDFTGDKHGVLVDDQFFKASSKPAETMIDRLTDFF